LRAVSAEGTPSGGEALVNELTDGVQAAPRVSASADGAFAVAFTDRSATSTRAILQRYTAFGRPIPGDQAKPYAERLGDVQEVAVAVAANVTVLSWLDRKDGTVRARLFGASTGFALNPITGTEAEFDVAGTRAGDAANLRVSIGPANTAAFVWQDVTRGIVGLKFPVVAPE
jgi:hypothetical protein